MMSKRFVLVFAMSGIALLALAATISQPIRVELSELQNHEGKEVTAEGVVIDMYETKTGNWVAKLRNENTTVPVFVKGSLNAELGDEIRVTGRVQAYNGEYEIVVLDGKGIEVIRGWSESSISIAQLKHQPEKYKATNLNVTGYASSISSSGFTLVDNLTTCRCFIKVIIRKTLVLPVERQLVYVKALLVYDENSFSYFLKLDSTAHGVGVID